MSFIGTREQVAYSQGVEDAMRLAAGQPAMHGSDNPLPFFYQRGLSDQKQGFALVPWDLVTATALTAEQQRYYLEGFQRGNEIRKGQIPGPPPTPATRDEYEWRTAGTYDGQEGKSARYVITTEPRIAKDYGPKSGGPVIVVPPPPNTPPLVYSGPPIYEVAAYFAGKLVPLDQFLSVSQYTEKLLKNPGLRALWAMATRFEVLGDAPGEERKGYRLSGPNGRVAKYLALLQQQPRPPFPLDPQYYGLPAWFVTKVKGQGSRGGIRFLSRRELLDLGIDPDGGEAQF